MIEKEREEILEKDRKRRNDWKMTGWNDRRRKRKKKNRKERIEKERKDRKRRNDWKTTGMKW